MKSFDVQTRSRTQFINIDRQVQETVTASGIQEGVVQLHIPHTTAAVTINENADPDVMSDIEGVLDTMVPWNKGYAHAEGNTAAHVKSSLFGCDQSVIIQGGRLQLGTWQSLYFCEFDGPRTRRVWVQVIGD